MGNSRALTVFYESVKSKATKRQYDYQLNYFVKYYKIRSIESVLEIEPKKLQEFIEDYVIYLKKKGLNRSYINMGICALQGFLIMNDVFINWPKIRKLLPEKKTLIKDRPWRTDEIQKMLSATTSLRNKAMIHFLAASGVRVGSLPGLRLKHLAEIGDGCKSVIVYADSEEEYITFLHPEASMVLDDYLAQRTKDRECLKPESPVFRERYSIGMAFPKPITENVLRGMIKSVLANTNLRQEKQNGRYEQMRFHGFRKRFNTILKLNKQVNSNIAEKLMGHKKGLDGVYFKPTRDELFEEYKKAISDLTINDAERVKVEKQKMEAEKKTVEESSKKNEELEKIIEKLSQKQAKTDRKFELMRFLLCLKNSEPAHPRNSKDYGEQMKLREQQENEANEELMKLMKE